MTQSNTSHNFPGPCPLNSTHFLALTLPPTHTHLLFSLICSAQQTNKQTINNWVSSQFHWFCSQLCLEIHPGSAGDYLSSNAANCLLFPNNEKPDRSLRRHNLPLLFTSSSPASETLTCPFLFALTQGTTCALHTMLLSCPQKPLCKWNQENTSSASAFSNVFPGDSHMPRNSHALCLNDLHKLAPLLAPHLTETLLLPPKCAKHKVTLPNP